MLRPLAVRTPKMSALHCRPSCVRASARLSRRVLPALLLLLLVCCTAAQPSGVPEKDENPFFAKFVTSDGTFVIEINPSWSPLGAERFLELVRANYFDGQKVFRVIPNFLVQFGYNGDPAVTSKFSNQHIADDPFKVSNYKGYVAFAGSSKDSRSTHIFINLVDNFFIDHRDVWATPFARVVTGFDVVERFYSGYQRGEKRGDPMPQQGLIGQRGNAYLDREFPKLSTINTVRLIRMPPPPTGARAETAAAGSAGAPAARAAAGGSASSARDGSAVQRPEGSAQLSGVTLRPLPAHWVDVPSLDAASLDDMVEFPSGYGRGSRAAAKWIRLNLRMDALANEDRAQDDRKQALLDGLSSGAGTGAASSSSGSGGRPALPSARHVRGNDGSDDGAAAPVKAAEEFDVQHVVSKAIEANEAVAEVVAQKLGSELRAAEDEIAHGSPVVLFFALFGALALVWLVCTKCIKLAPKAKE
jgi:peptidyl-prolyl cis-trans isomerase A (cyclophilin A)